MITYQYMCCFLESFFSSWVTPMIIIAICTMKFLVIPYSKYTFRNKKASKRKYEALNPQTVEMEMIKSFTETDSIVSNGLRTIKNKNTAIETVLNISQNPLQMSMISNFGTPLSAQNTWKTVVTKVRNEDDKENNPDPNDSYNYFNSLGCNENHDLSFVSVTKGQQNVNRRNIVHSLKAIQENVQLHQG